jgi:hypothetical protein
MAEVASALGDENTRGAQGENVARLPWRAFGPAQAVVLYRRADQRLEQDVALNVAQHGLQVFVDRGVFDESAERAVPPVDVGHHTVEAGRDLLELRH